MSSDQFLKFEKYRQVASDSIDSTINKSICEVIANKSLNGSNSQTKLNQLNRSTDNSQNKETESNISIDQMEKNVTTNGKRPNYLIWDDYFMSVALLSAQSSKDPCTQVGACIVNDDHKIVSIGYNGMPMNCNDDLLPWTKGSDNELENKYLYVCHAELNAVLNCNIASSKDCTIYTTHFPCNECAKVIIQAGIRKVYYLQSKGEDKPGYIASKRLLNMANVKLIHYQPKEKQIILDLNQCENNSISISFDLCYRTMCILLI